MVLVNCEIEDDLSVNSQVNVASESRRNLENFRREQQRWTLSHRNSRRQLTSLRGPLSRHRIFKELNHLTRNSRQVNKLKASVVSETYEPAAIQIAVLESSRNQKAVN